MANSSSEKALFIFRRLLKQAQKLPDKERTEAHSQIRLSFYNNRNISDSNTIGELLKKAESSLGYLKMITPKSRGQSEPYHQVFGNKESDTPVKKAVTNWHVSLFNCDYRFYSVSNLLSILLYFVNQGGNMDPDSVARHNATLKRAGFKNNAHAKGVF